MSSNNLLKRYVFTIYKWIRLKMRLQWRIRLELLSGRGLNPKNIFGAVYYTDAVARLTAGKQKKYLDAIAKGIEGLAFIRQNRKYCEFLKDELGCDLFKAFYNCENSALLIHVQDTDTINMMANIKTLPELNCYSLAITSTVDFLTAFDNDGMEAAVNHELGHFLMTSSECSASEVIDKFKILRRNQTSYKDLWKEEFDADKLAVAINPKLNIGKLLTQASQPNDWLNGLYQQGKFGKRTANILANFVASRDTILAEICSHPKFNIGEQVNSAFKMNYSQDHPASIRRAVESDKFAEKVTSFLKLST